MRVDCTLLSTSRSLNTSLITSTPPTLQLSPQISTQNFGSSVDFSARNATDLRKKLGPFEIQKRFSRAYRTLKSEPQLQTCLWEGTNDFKTVILSRDRMLLTVSMNVSMRRHEQFENFSFKPSSNDALAKLYLNSSEDPRFLNKRVIIEQVNKVNLHFWQPPSPRFILGSPFQLLLSVFILPVIKPNLAPKKPLASFGVRHCCSVASALFRVTGKESHASTFECDVCLYKDVVAELLDGSEGAGRANGCEFEMPNCSMGFVDEVPTNDEVPNCSMGGVDRTMFLLFSFHGVSLKPRPAATAI